MHPDRTIESGISYSQKLHSDSISDVGREASVQVLKKFASKNPADIKVKLKAP